MTLNPSCSCPFEPKVAGLTHLAGCQYYLPKSPPSDLTELLRKLKELRGSPEEWLRRDYALLKFMAATSESDRILARGELHLPNKGHYPAIVIYHSDTNVVDAWSATGDDDTVGFYPLKYFFPNAQYAGNARETLSPETTAVGTLDVSIADQYIAKPVLG